MRDSKAVAIPRVIPSALGRRKYLAAFIAVVLGLIVAAYLFLFYAADRDVARALAEADKLDPSWRLEDLEARRVAVPDEDNSALQTMAVANAIPPNWPSWFFPAAGQVSDLAERQRKALEESFSELPPPVQLSEDQLAALGGEIGRAAAAVALARKLADMPRGRHPITYAPDWISTMLPTVQCARSSVNVLQYDALLRAHAGDIDGALLSARAALNAGRSLADEPFLITLLIRHACQTIALRAVERALAQGEASEGALRLLQQIVEEEENDPGFLVALRGERAGVDQAVQFLSTSKLTNLHQMTRMMSGLAAAPGPAVPHQWETLRMYLPGSLKANRAALIRYQTQLVEIAKLPTEQQEARIRALVATLPKQPVLVRMLAPAVTKVAGVHHRGVAQLRCVSIMVAAERYRLDHGDWPDEAAMLVPRYLAHIPADPFDGQPLRFRRLEDGVVIYSVSHDRADNSGKFDKNPMVSGTDWGYRLWDVAKRRQRPVPLKIAPAPNLAEAFP